MKRFVLLLSLIFFYLNLFSQEIPKVLKLTSQEVESLFLENNLELLAGKLDISLADAQIIQAKYWENPVLSIDNVNLWTTKRQREEGIPPLFGSFGKNMEFSVELSQLIETAGKRRKRVGMENISKEITIAEFEDLLRGLKIELRKSIYEYIYLDALCSVVKSELKSLTDLTEIWEGQVKEGNFPKTELLRLQSAQFELENELNELYIEFNEAQKNLRILLNVEPDVDLQILPVKEDLKNPQELHLRTLIQLATDRRPDIQSNRLQTNYFEKELAYEKAQRVPDVTVNANYDRYGGVWKDFIGFGVSIDLPVLNQNRGNIKVAQISGEQSQYRLRQQTNLLENEIAEALNNYRIAYHFFEKVEANPIVKELDAMYELYIQSLVNRNISMMEFVDFMESYKNNKQILLSAAKNQAVLFEELQYAVGVDIK